MIAIRSLGAIIACSSVSPSSPISGGGKESGPVGDHYLTIALMMKTMGVSSMSPAQAVVYSRRLCLGAAVGVGKLAAIRTGYINGIETTRQQWQGMTQRETAEKWRNVLAAEVIDRQPGE
ncbi:hypothetical protein An17g01210 [Aspergillus niger]|uniref:Uncharacterized protein n=2 Tax=Aspergillus niger TaxID=5061 RepID=A2R9F8_ASPNC|nr:hypothetical protein An17g01210 [Aspergillus niger]CAK43017.1 hypothetical protein An17g01210 [Aspergillus niger]